MPVPKHKISRTQRRKRRSHMALAAANVTFCKKCAAPLLPHRACMSCGHYKGKKVLEVDTVA